ncbi:E3 ubiquitin-protein ligase RSL1-like [Capsicum chacoense]
MEVTNPKSSVHINVYNDIFMCDICADEKFTSTDMFKIMGCSHSYCKNCIAKYISSKLQENISRILCPVTTCTGELEPQSCGSILPYDVFVKWGDALCESMILVAEKFYCPFKDCSALLIDECAGENMVIDQSECPECRKLFCAKCKVPWHSGFVCEEFDKLNNDEREVEGLQLMKLAKSQGWQRCPSCMMYVEKSEGCLHMICRCGCEFCYNCATHSNGYFPRLLDWLDVNSRGAMEQRIISDTRFLEDIYFTFRKFIIPRCNLQFVFPTYDRFVI